MERAEGEEVRLDRDRAPLRGGSKWLPSPQGGIECGERLAVENEVELISDGDGLAVIGKPGAIERFMSATGLSKRETKSLPLVLSAGASAAQAGAQVAAESGRWLN